MSEKLTDRELEALRLTAQGYVGKDVVDKMHISLSVVRYTLGSVQRKLEAKTLSHAVSIGYEMGILFQKTEEGDGEVPLNRKGITFCQLCNCQVFDVEEHIRTPEHEKNLRLRNKAEEHVTERVVNLPIVKLDNIPPDRGILHSKLPDGREVFVIITGKK